MAPFKHVMRFERKGKLAPKYINSYEIMEQVGKAAYRFALLVSIKRIHDVFYFLSLCIYIGDLSHVLRTKKT